MKKIKNNYTKFILTVIAVAMIGILFKGEKIITSAHAIERHGHIWQDITSNSGTKDLQWFVKSVVANYCFGMQNQLRTNNPIACR